MSGYLSLQRVVECTASIWSSKMCNGPMHEAQMLLTAIHPAAAALGASNKVL
jgi:hypothetical protein